MPWKIFSIFSRKSQPQTQADVVDLRQVVLTEPEILVNPRPISQTFAQKVDPQSARKQEARKSDDTTSSTGATYTPAYISGGGYDGGGGFSGGCDGGGGGAVCAPSFN